jgi:hypothetical protein
MPKAISHPSPSSPHRVSLAFFASLPCTSVLLCAFAVLMCAPAISATQTAPQDSTQNPPGSPLKPHPTPTFHQTRSHLHPASKPTQPPVDATPPLQVVAVPELPHWPANEKPEPAHVVWDSHGLSIDAANSSLSDILTEISTLTGAHVDGFATDARVYGKYGPAPARDVLSQLLDGTGYNVMMIGDLGQGAPRQIVLSTRTAGSAIPSVHPTTPAEDDADVEEPAQPQPSPMQPLRAPFNPATIRNPQQFPPDMQHPQGQPGQFPQGQQPLPGQPPQQQNQ